MTEQVGKLLAPLAMKNARLEVDVRTDALRGYAGLGDLNAVYLVGSGNSIEIWSQAKWKPVWKSSLFSAHW